MDKQEASKIERAIYREFKDLSFGPDSKLNSWQLTMALSILMDKDEPSLRILHQLKHEKGCCLLDSKNPMRSQIVLTPRKMIKGVMNCWREHLTQTREKRVLEDIKTATGDIFLHVFLPKQGLSESTIETLRVNGVYSYSELKEIKSEALRHTGITRKEITIIRKL